MSRHDLVASWMRAMALALLMMVPCAAARAQVAAAERIAAGRDAYEVLDYERAIVELEGALRVPSISPLERARALETLAFALVVLDRERDARDRLRQLFALDPYYDVREPTGSPIVQSLVDRVRHELVTDAALDPALSVRLELPSTARADRPITVRVHLTGPGADRVTQVVLVHRGQTDTDWSSTLAAPDAGLFMAEIPALGRSEALELYAEGRDGEGRLLVRSAGPLSPTLLEVEEASTPASENLLESWWLWTLVGVVVVGTAIGIGAGVAASDGAAPSGTLPPGRVILP